MQSKAPTKNYGDEKYHCNPKKDSYLFVKIKFHCTIYQT